MCYYVLFVVCCLQVSGKRNMYGYQNRDLYRLAQGTTQLTGPMRMLRTSVGRAAGISKIFELKWVKMHVLMKKRLYYVVIYRCFWRWYYVCTYKAKWSFISCFFQFNLIFNLVLEVVLY